MRVGTFTSFARVLLGIRQNQGALFRAQEQLTSGRRVLRPSDDPVDAAASIRLRRHLTDVGRYRDAILLGRNTVDAAASSLQGASSMMSEAREFVLRGMNGTLSDDEREALADAFDNLKRQLLEIANARAGDRYLFGGTETSSVPWVETTVAGEPRVVYRGNDEVQELLVGDQAELPLVVPGSGIFGRFEPTGTLFAGLTGVMSGVTASDGTGYAHLTLRHDSTNPGTLGSVGIGLVNGGADDTILGANTLVIDPVERTVQLGSGPVMNMPSVASPDFSNFTVHNELGGELHLDLSSWNGAAFNGAVTGNGSISLDGTNFTALSFTETDLQLRDDAAGVVLHVDATAVRRAGSELITFAGTTNVFDLMGGIAEDLRNADGLTQPELLSRLNQRLQELDRNHENIVSSLGVMGARSARLSASEQRALDLGLLLESRLSEAQDADFAEVAVDLARADTILQVAQASGARLMQTTLLNFLG